MEKQLLINFSNAKLAKIKGYNESTLYFYDNDKEVCSFANATFYHNDDKNRYSAPTQKELMNWLEDNYKIKISTETNNNSCKVTILFIDQEDYWDGFIDKKDAIDFALIKCLLFLKDKKIVY